MKKRKFKAPVKPLAWLVVIALAVFFVFIAFSRVARNSSLFVIRDIVIRQDNAATGKADLSFLLGRNLIFIDLEAEERKIAGFYPGCQKVKLVRVLPDRLVAYFISRQPVAMIKLNRYFFVDQAAVLFEIPAATPAPGIGLPVIYGLERKISGPKPGRKYNYPELVLGVNIIRAARSNRQLRGLKIIRIDVADPANAALVISLPVTAQAKAPAGMEVKIGQDYLVDKMNILASLLIQGRSDWDNIKYIDLRFKEPVMKFKDQDKKER
jgi:cell division septal protein FtsQ